MNNVWLALAAAFILSACNSPLLRPGAALERINQEMAEAAKPKAPPAEALGKAMMPPLQLDAPVAPAPEPRFNLAVNNAPASQVFMALVSGTRYSMIFAPDLSGNITLNLKNVTVREALDTIREIYGYEYRVQGNRIMIQANTLQTRIFQINYLASRRQGSSDTRVTSSSPSIVTPGAANAGANAAGSTAPTGTPAGPGGTTLRSTDSSRVQTILENDFWKDLKLALDAIVGNEGGRNVIMNPVSGVVLVKALPAEMRGVEAYLKATQLVVERQVMLEAKIIDVQLSDAFQTGINWAAFDKNGNHRWSNNANIQNLPWGGNTRSASSSSTTMTDTLSNTGTSTTISRTSSSTTATTPLNAALGGAAGVLNAFPFPGGKGAALAFQTGSFAALISFLENQGSVYVLSNPRIATINNQKAVLKVGGDDYFVTGISTTTTSTATGNQVTPNITLQPFFSGIALDVTPQIDNDGNIILHIHPAVTMVEERSKQVNLGDLGTFTLPLASSTINETDSVVRVQDGHIVAIGGLMSQDQRKSRNGLPLLSRAPGLGALFGQTDDSAAKRELVFLIKPTVIDGDSSWREDLVETQGRLQNFAPPPSPLSQQ